MKIGVCGKVGRQKGQTRGRAEESHQNADRQELLVYICSDASQEASEASAGVVLRGASFATENKPSSIVLHSLQTASCFVHIKSAIMARIPLCKVSVPHISKLRAR